MYKECWWYFCTIWFIFYILKRNYFNSFENIWIVSVLDFLILIYVYFLMKIKIPWSSLNDSAFIIWVLSNRILGISWSSCCVNVDFPHIKEKLAAKHLFTQQLVWVNIVYFLSYMLLMCIIFRFPDYLNLISNMFLKIHELLFNTLQ